MKVSAASRTAYQRESIRLYMGAIKLHSKKAGVRSSSTPASKKPVATPSSSKKRALTTEVHLDQMDQLAEEPIVKALDEWLRGTVKGPIVLPQLPAPSAQPMPPPVLTLGEIRDVTTDQGVVYPPTNGDSFINRQGYRFKYWNGVWQMQAD